MSPLLPLLPLLCLCFVEQSSVLLGCEHWGLHGHSLFTCVDSLICMGIYTYYLLWNLCLVDGFPQPNAVVQ